MGEKPKAHLDIPPDGIVTVLIGVTGHDGVRGFVTTDFSREMMMDHSALAVAMSMLDDEAQRMIMRRLAESEWVTGE